MIRIQLLIIWCIYIHTQSLYIQNAAHATSIHSKYVLQVKFLKTFGVTEQTYYPYHPSLFSTFNMLGEQCARSLLRHGELNGRHDFYRKDAIVPFQPMRSALFPEHCTHRETQCYFRHVNVSIKPSRLVKPRMPSTFSVLSLRWNVNNVLIIHIIITFSVCTRLMSITAC